MYEGYFIALTLVVVVAAAVWWDADSRGDPNAAAWGVGTGLLLIIVLPLYLYHRAYRRQEKESIEPVAVPETVKKDAQPTQVPSHHVVAVCSNCRSEIPPDSKFCKECGTKLSEY